MSARALALLAGEAMRLSKPLAKMQTLARDLPLTIQIEVNNIEECLDLLRFKIREETLARAIHDPPQPRPARPQREGKRAVLGQLDFEDLAERKSG